MVSFFLTGLLGGNPSLGSAGFGMALPAHLRALWNFLYIWCSLCQVWESSLRCGVRGAKVSEGRELSRRQLWRTQHGAGCGHCPGRALPKRSV